MFSFIGVPVVIGYRDGGFDKPEMFDNIVGQFTVEYTTANDNMIYGRLSTGHNLVYSTLPRHLLMVFHR